MNGNLESYPPDEALDALNPKWCPVCERPVPEELEVAFGGRLLCICGRVFESEEDET